MTSPTHTAARPTEPTAADFRAMQNAPEFLDLKKTFRGFVFPMSVAFFLWYVLYVVTATFAPDFMAKPVFGLINVGIIFGVLQFVSTFAITWSYVKFANREIEPRAAKIRAELEGEV